jgi:hypothetical protein
VRAEFTVLNAHKVSLANCYFPMIPQDSPSCYGSTMRNLLALFIHFICRWSELHEFALARINE